MDLTELYQSLILDHNRSPRNSGELAGANRVAEGRNPMCGDQLRVWLKVDGDRIADVAFVGKGCAISQASASLMTTVVKGKTRAEAELMFDRFHDLVTGKPLDDSTRNMIDGRRIALLKKGAVLINTARGGIVDEAALYDALKNKRIAGAALDVFVQEPTPQDNPLLTLDNFIAAPHVAGVTREAVDRMAVVAVQNILSVLDGKPNRENVVNREVLQ